MDRQVEYDANVSRGFDSELKQKPDVGVDRVIINVGGTRHECYINTIQNFPDTRLYWIAETALKMADFDPEGNEFFFDRHPGCFVNILNYCRTGKLHCPNDICGPLYEEELKFWGVDELMMEPCCWANYTQYRDAHEHLKIFDQYYKSELEQDIGHVKPKPEGQKANLLQNIKHVQFVVWNALDNPGKTIFTQLLALIMLVVTLSSIITFCMETMERFKDARIVFTKLELFYCLFFTADFVTRLLSCPCKWMFFKSFTTWMDVLATAQFYLALCFDFHTHDILFVFRLLRIFRLLRFFKHFSGMFVIGQTLAASATELALLALILSVPMVIFSTLVFYVEQDREKFSSIPETFWWAIVTMTTVGYGDVVPETPWGKLLGAACAFAGCLIVALPISVIGNNFSFYYSYAQARMKLPKRQYHAMIAADKGLIASEEEESSEYNFEDEENSYGWRRSSSRRSAIRPSTGPIQKSVKRDSKQEKKNGSDSGGSLSSIFSWRKRLSKDIRALAEYKKDDTISLLSHNGNTKKSIKTRSSTITAFPKEIRMENVKRLTQSTDCISQSTEYLACERRKVLHLDISYYEPHPVDTSTHAIRRNGSQYNSPVTKLAQTERTLLHTPQNDRKRKPSILKRIEKNRDVVVYMQEMKT